MLPKRDDGDSMMQRATLPSPLVRLSSASFFSWKDNVLRAGLPPVIAVAGSRGKSTVVRLLQAIFQDAGLRTAIWTDQGVEIEGRRQVGELVPWSRALGRATDGELDVAIQELDWATVHAVGLPPESYPLAAITNLCVNSESCLVQTESRRAAKAMAAVERAVAAAGTLVLNADDFAVAAERRGTSAAIVLVGSSKDAPLLRAHLVAGGRAAWSHGARLQVGARDQTTDLGAVQNVAVGQEGAVTFQIHNALVAAATAIRCGIPSPSVARTIATFVPTPKQVPGSFNVVQANGVTVVVDRPAPSWFLRSSLRAVAHIPAHRLLTVIGDLSDVPSHDLPEVGRLVGRAGGAVIVTDGPRASERAALLRLGIGANEVPPLIMRKGSERSAVTRALSLAQPGDLIFVLARDPRPVLRQIERAGTQPAQEEPAR
jgi:UDP-N-acetylmuramyl tripeptide synthase